MPKFEITVRQYRDGSCVIDVPTQADAEAFAERIDLTDAIGWERQHGFSWEPQFTTEISDVSELLDS